MVLLQLLAAAAAACAVCANPADARVFSGLTYGLFILLGSVFSILAVLTRVVMKIERKRAEAR